MTQTVPRLGLRERKKQRTRQTIIEVAIHLFGERGYSETTLAQIADVAEIAPSTFFNYFRSKVDIVFAANDAISESARERIVGRPSGESAADAVVSWIREDLGEVERPFNEALRWIPKIIASDPELVAENRLRLALIEDIFAEGFASDLHETAEGMRARVMAAITLRAILDVWNAWYEHHFGDPEFDLADLLLVKAEYVNEVLVAGLAAVANLPSPPDDL
ncbi:MAG TPA: TetR/AcrR family transcriptional regulator [Gaiellaceae bacterium]|jgi:AcrR family transcriptional regulator|nr:TetR/AcrR family transcriptional regulator [Gaiellaceae bacterium]